MSEESVKREVIIVLNLEAGEGNEEIANKVKEQVEKSAREAVASEKDAAGERIEIEKSIWENRLKMLEEYKQAREKSFRDEATVNEAAAREFEKRNERELNAFEQAHQKRREVEEKSELESARASQDREREKSLSEQRESADRERSMREVQEQAEHEVDVFKEAEKKKVEAAGETAKAREELAAKSKTIGEESASHSVESHKKAAEEASHLYEEGIEANRKLGEATKQALDGSLLLAKGLTMVGLLNEESTQKMVEGFVKIEAGFNIIKGGITAYYALKDAVEAAAKAQMLFSAAESLGGVGGAVGGAVAGKVGKSIIGDVATGAAGSAVGGAVVGGGAKWLPTAGRAFMNGMKLDMTGTAAFPTLGRLVPSAATAGGAASTAAWGAGALALGAVGGYGLSKGLNMTGAYQALGYGSSNPKDRYESTFGALYDWHRVAGEVSRGDERIATGETRLADRRAAAEDERHGILTQANTAAQRRNNQEDLASRRDRLEMNINPRLSSERKETELIKRERLRAIQEIERAEAAVAQAEETRLDRQKKGQSYIAEIGLTASQRLYDAAQRRLQIEEKQVDVLARQKEAMKASVELGRSRLEQAKSTLEAEQEATEDRTRKFGQHSAGEQQQLLEISRRYKETSTVTRADVDFLKKTGHADIPAVRDFDLKEGQKVGGEEFQNNFGLRDKEAEAKNTFSRRESDLAQTQQQQIEAAAKYTEATQAATKAMNELTRIIHWLEEKWPRAAFKCL